MFPQALRADSILGRPPAPARVEAAGSPAHQPVAVTPASAAPAPAKPRCPITFPQKDTRPFFHVCLTHLLHVPVYDFNVPCRVVSSGLSPCLLTSGKSRGFNRAYCCCQQEPDLDTKFQIQSAALQMQLSALPILWIFPWKKERGKKKQKQKGRHRPLLFLCRAIQGNRFRAGLFTLSGVRSTGGFSAAKLFYNLRYGACHHAGHGCRLRNRAREKVSAAQTHTQEISKNHRI